MWKTMLPRMALVLFLAAPALAPARGQDEAPSRKGKFFLVPEAWLSLGTYTHVEMAPLLGYHVTDRLSFALGPHYMYLSQKASAYNPTSYRTHLYGGKAFGRFALITHAEEFVPLHLFNDLFVQVEYEGLSMEKLYFYAPGFPDDGRFLYQGLLVGGGITQRLGVFNSMSILVLWDLNESSRSPYSNPVFRVGFNTYFK
ncbi:MAG: hypothetical protein R2751_05075 [Bacteroidales bacterium]